MRLCNATGPLQRQCVVVEGLTESTLVSHIAGFAIDQLLEQPNGVFVGGQRFVDGPDLLGECRHFAVG